MSEKIVQLNEEIIKGQIKELVRGSVEETLNELLEKEAESLTQAARYERNETRQGYRSGHYNRNLTTTSGNITPAKAVVSALLTEEETLLPPVLAVTMATAPPSRPQEAADLAPHIPAEMRQKIL